MFKITYNKSLIFIVTFCGTGLLSKRMPGTIGSLAATSLSYIIPKYSVLFYVTSILLFVIGTITSQQYVNQHPENKDPGFIVIDEACAIFLSNAILLNIFEYSYTVFLLSFIFFRVFDILKPWPIKKIDSYFKQLDINSNQKVQSICNDYNKHCNKYGYKMFLNGFGIMIDDVVAVIPTIIIIIIISYIMQEYCVFGY